MAAKIGMPAGTLYNKSNLNDSSLHKPSLAEAVLVQVISSDTRIVEAMAHVLGGLFVRIPTIDAVSDAALLEMITEIHVQSGRYHAEIKEALADGKFSRDEHVRIYKQALKFIRAVLESVQRIEGMVDE
ncbi:phage regulatory CII family protein [Collimonas pratensis]|uniref:Phage regulatory CII family protein n=2 Tax=Collimonas pratensis TaxID=279113 RepID=A0ABM5Z3D6_9BURK|nr:phage regulatory CII family protein [Collimonas pratensis]